MTSKLFRGIAIAAIVILMVYTGFLRDWMSVNINFQLGFLYYGWDENPTSPLVVRATEGLEYITIWRFKWLLTIITAMVYATMTATIGYLAFLDRKFIRLTLISFLVVIVVSGVFYVLGQFFGSNHQGYLLARALMDFVQSPFVLMVLIPAFFLSTSGALAAKSEQ